MAARQDPRSEIWHEWGAGTAGWDLQMDADLQILSRFGFHPQALSRSISTPPTAPVDGDTYIVGPAATGDWAGYDNYLAYWDGQAATPAWQLFAPKQNLIVYVEDEGIAVRYDSTLTAWTRFPVPLTTTAASSAGTLDVDTAQDVVDVTLTESITTLNLNNPPASGQFKSVRLMLRQDATGGWTVTWPTYVDWGAVGAPTLSGASLMDIVELSTVDGGTSWQAVTIGQGFAA